jgi:hypothetical protein
MQQVINPQRQSRKEMAARLGFRTWKACNKRMKAMRVANPCFRKLSGILVPIITKRTRLPEIAKAST